MPSSVLILGATSAIAIAVAREYAGRSAVLCLVGRNHARLEEVAGDLRARGAEKVAVLEADLVDTSRHDGLLAEAYESIGEIPQVVLVAYGTLGDQKAGEASFEVARRELETNFLSTTSLLTRIANHFETRSSGVIAVIASVAGDRGRKSNYIYGAAKGGLAIFLQGLRNRLASAGVAVVTLKPGFVDTPMTASFKKGALWASPEQVGARIVRAIDRKSDVVYCPWFWRFIMLIICSIPEQVFKKLSL